MFLAKKLLSSLILPPGVYSAALFIVAILYRKNKKLSAILFMLALSSYLLATELVRDLLFYYLEKDFRESSKLNANIIVVLGGGVYSSGHLKGSSYKRLITAYMLHRKTGKPLVLSGGSVSGRFPEAEVMKNLLIDIGVDPKAIYTDVSSRNTYENAKFVKEICSVLGCKNIILVTSAFHMKRALSVFKKAGLSALPYATDFRYDGRYTVYSLIPRADVFFDSSTALREYVALLFYSIAY